MFKMFVAELHSGLPRLLSVEKMMMKDICLNDG